MKSVRREHVCLDFKHTLFLHALYGIVMWIWYRSLFFRCFSTLSLIESRILLVCIIIICALVGLSIDTYIIKKNDQPFINLLIGYGIYAALTYYLIKPRLVLVSIVSVVVLAIIYSTVTIQSKGITKDKSHHIFIRSVRRAIGGTKTIVSIGFGFIFAFIGLPLIFGGFLVKPAINPAKPNDSQEWTLSNNIEDVSLFFNTEEWSSSTITSKLNTCQVLANIYQAKWGINELNVVASNTSDILAGYYDDSEHLILINVDYLMSASGPDVCNTVIHEAYHALEHRMVDAYLATPDEMKGLELYREAYIYMTEFENYHDIKSLENNDDYYAYANQLCEINARIYAQNETEMIEYIVREYTRGNE